MSSFGGVGSDVSRIESTLRNFLEDLADTENVLHSINDNLSRRAYTDFMGYYLKTHRLTGYFEKELRRMSFIVKYDGVEYANKEEIMSIYEINSLLDIWRLGNQSIYADVLAALQERFVRPELSISVISSSSHFVIDLDSNMISAKSLFRFVTLRGRSLSSSSTSSCRVDALAAGLDHNKLELGSATGIVEVDLSRQTLIQRIESPALNFVFDEDLRLAAEAIATLRMHESCDPSSSSFDAGDFDTKAHLGHFAKSVKKTGLTLAEGMVGAIGKLVGAAAQTEHHTSRSGLLPLTAALKPRAKSNVADAQTPTSSSTSASSFSQQQDRSSELIMLVDGSSSSKANIASGVVTTPKTTVSTAAPSNATTTGTAATTTAATTVVKVPSPDDEWEDWD